MQQDHTDVDCDSSHNCTKQQSECPHQGIVLLQPGIVLAQTVQESGPGYEISQSSGYASSQFSIQSDLEYVSGTEDTGVENVTIGQSTTSTSSSAAAAAGSSSSEKSSSQEQATDNEARHDSSTCVQMHLGEDNSSQEENHQRTQSEERNRLPVFEQNRHGDNILMQIICAISRYLPLRKKAMEIINSVKPDQHHLLNQQNCKGYSAMHLAAQLGETKVLMQLAKAGADFTLRDLQGNTPFHIACNTRGFNSHIAMACFQFDMPEKLKTFVSEKDQNGNTPLHLACFHGNIKLVRQIVSEFTNRSTVKHVVETKNCCGQSCLYLAGISMTTRVGGDPRHAIQRTIDCFKVVQYLLDVEGAVRADSNQTEWKYGRSLLHLAVSCDNTMMLMELLRHPNIVIDCMTFDGQTPLMMAKNTNNYPIINCLMAAGADASKAGYFTKKELNPKEEDNPVLGLADEESSLSSGTDSDQSDVSSDSGCQSDDANR